MTVQGKYPPYPEYHHRVVAILQVVEIYETHLQGKNAYLRLKLPIPSNCMVMGNQAYDFDKTAGNFQNKKEMKAFLHRNQKTQSLIGQRKVAHWDNNYLQKSQRWTCFVRTKTLYKNLTDPVPIFRQDFELIFGKIPNTRTPNKISARKFKKLTKLAGINVTL